MADNKGECPYVELSEVAYFVILLLQLQELLILKLESILCFTSRSFLKSYEGEWENNTKG